MRTMPSELGENSSIRINDGELIYSTSTKFTSSEHGYEAIALDVGNVSIGASIKFNVSKDTSRAKSAINKLVEEFNDAQDYISSLTRVDQSGEDVTSERFTGNQEINRLASELRRAVFGSSYPHSESESTSDSANLTIGNNNNDNDELNAISSDMNFDENDEGYIIKVLNDKGSGNSAYYEWDGDKWVSSPVFSVFRLSNIGLDFELAQTTSMLRMHHCSLKNWSLTQTRLRHFFQRFQ